jgi:hypothetical protein
MLNSFWTSFANWYAGMINKNLKITLENIIVGFLDKNEKTDTLNACMLLAKWHIYKNKLNHNHIFFYRFICELKYYIQTERTIAIKNNQAINYINTWQMVEQYIT